MELTKAQKTQINSIVVYTRVGLNEFLEIFLTDKEDNPDAYKIPSKHHYRISDMFLQNLDTNNHVINHAIQAARQFGKTSLMQAYLLHRVVYPVKEDTYIVLIKQNQKLAEEKLRELINTYKGNPFFMQYSCVSILRDSQKIFEIISQDSEGKQHTVRIEAYGKGSSIRGLLYGSKRPTTICADDLNDYEDSLSNTQMEKDWEWFLSDIRGLGKQTRVLMIGNNLGESCLIERIFKAAEQLNFSTFRLPAMTEVKDEKTGKVSMKSNWEEMFPVDFLISEKEDFTKMGKLDVWYRERMCLPMSAENQIFKKEYFQYFDNSTYDELVKSDKLRYYITVDPAISQKETADDTVICVTAFHQETNDMYIVDYIAERLTPIETIEATISMYQKYRPIRVGIETVAYQLALVHFLMEEQSRRGIYFFVTELRSQTKKEIRIQALQPLFRTQKVFHRKTQLKFEEQLLTFPKGIHDDVIDAASMVLLLKEESDKVDDYTLKKEQFEYEEWIQGT